MEKDYQNLLKKIQETIKKEKLDLSSDEDLSIAVMNLISLEEHFYFTFQKTKKEEYLDYLNEIREIRKELLKKLIGKNYEGELWCCSKHLLATSMRLIEVGTKELNKGNKKESQNLFEKAYQLWSLFWVIKLKIVKFNEDLVKKYPKEIKIKKEKISLFSKLGEIIKKIVDCCKE